jgi:hypothetical protein
MSGLRLPLPVIGSLAGLTLLSACATPFEARVSRFQALPAPQGQSFTIEPSDASKRGSLEFATYAGLVTQRLQGLGFQPATAPGSGTLRVTLDYGVGPGREKVQTTPGSYSPFWGGYGLYSRGFYGRGFYGRGFYQPYFGGFYDPFWGGGFGGPEVYSYTQFPAFLTMRINRAVDNQSLFEGRAESVARTNDLTRLVPNLVDAVFTNFPGNSGEVVRVRVPQGNTTSGAAPR